MTYISSFKSKEAECREDDVEIRISNFGKLHFSQKTPPESIKKSYGFGILPGHFPLDAIPKLFFPRHLVLNKSHWFL